MFGSAIIIGIGFLVLATRFERSDHKTSFLSKVAAQEPSKQSAPCPMPESLLGTWQNVANAPTGDTVTYNADGTFLSMTQDGGHIVIGGKVNINTGEGTGILPPATATTTGLWSFVEDVIKEEQKNNNSLLAPYSAPLEFPRHTPIIRWDAGQMYPWYYSVEMELSCNQLRLTSVLDESSTIVYRRIQ